MTEFRTNKKTGQAFPVSGKKNSKLHGSTKSSGKKITSPNEQRLRFSTSERILESENASPELKPKFVRLARIEIKKLKVGDSIKFQNGLRVLKERETHPNDIQLELRAQPFRFRTVLEFTMNGKEIGMQPLTKWRISKKLMARDDW